MVGTLKRPRVARFLSTDQRAAMSASVVQDADHAVVAAHENQRAACHSSRAEVAGVRHLGFVADVEPALVEYAPPLLLKTFRIDECFPIYAKQPRVLIVDDEALDRFFHRLFHSASPAFGGSR